MPKQLSSAAIDAYHRDGYYFPVPALYVCRGGALSRLPGKAREPKPERPCRGTGGTRRTCFSPGSTSSCIIPRSSMRPRMCWAPIFCAGPPISSSRRRTARASCPGIRMRSTGVSARTTCHDRVGGAVARQSRKRLHEIPAGLADAGSPPARRHLPQGQPALARPGDRGQGGRRETPSIAFSIPARCRCITSSWCTARSPTAPTTGASGWRSATFQPTSSS